MIREVLRMGDPRLLERSREVSRFDTPALDALLGDMRDTMRKYEGAASPAPSYLRIVSRMSPSSASSAGVSKRDTSRERSSKRGSPMRSTSRIIAGVLQAI